MPIESLCLLSPNKTTADVGTISFVLSFDLYGLCLFCLFVYDMITNVLPVSVVVSLFLKKRTPPFDRHTPVPVPVPAPVRQIFLYSAGAGSAFSTFLFHSFFYLHLASHVARR
jgi:hypothetical protein